MTRCPRCHATNREDAPWCGQCHAPLARRGDPAGADAPQASGAAVRSTTGAGVFRRRDGEVEWACVTCGTYNPLGRSACSACGTRLTARYEPPRTAPAPATQAAVAASVVLPGAGHVMAGRGGSGVARAVLFCVWLGGGLLLAGAGSPPLLTMPLLLGAAAVWGGTLADVTALGRGRRELLAGRALLWLVVGVTLVLLLGVVVGVAGLG